ncbi:MAG: hypothetical protein A2Y90_06635 [Chloroflexi bacterium RBG_13_52_12]|nr:MAG: hypothetical protein A2Y90_06635 [Chloroflexi bacterium RBG_13_52_12]
MINAAAMKPFGAAIKDFYAGDNTAEVKIYRDDGIVSVMAISAFFRSATDFQLDRVLLDNCRGRVLDVGAGAGIHSQYLQSKGFSVCAMDVSPEACEVMRKRGVKEVRCASFTDFIAEPFDTLLILGRSICMVETLAGLDDFLRDAHRLVESGGQILLNSLDVSKTTNPENLAYHEANRRAGRYIGEIRLHMEYKGIKGPVTGLLHVDANTLTEHAAKVGWLSEVLLQEKDGNYAIMLTNKN